MQRVAGLVVAAPLSLCAVAPARAQCNGGMAYTATSGTQSAPVGYTSGALCGTNNSAISSDGKITATDPTSGSAYGLNFNAVGSAGSNGSSGGSGGESGFLTVNNTGAITITAGQADPVVGALFVDAGGNGGDATGNKGFGGNGGDAYGNITAVNSGSIFLTSNGGSFAAGATGLGLLAAGGNGGSGYTTSDNGINSGGGVAGGVVMPIDVTNSGSITIGQSSAFAAGSGGAYGISAVSTAGALGNATQPNNPFSSQALPNSQGLGAGTAGPNGGNGGNASGVIVTNDGPVGVYWSDTGGTTGVWGLYAKSTGGTGLVLMGSSSGNAGGPGGSGGAVTVTTTAPVTVQTANLNANATGAAVAALSIGGAGGPTWNNSTDGGAGGAGGDVTVTVSSSLTTSGNGVSGVLALSEGGTGGLGEDNAGATNKKENGGTGGAAGTVTVNLNAGGAIATSGAQAFGILALDFGGTGGGGSSFDNPGAGNQGDGGNGGNVAGIAVTTAGGTSINTTGQNAAAIAAEALSGPGGTGGDNTCTISCSGGNGGMPGSVGTVQVTNGATLSTAGAGAYGIVAQSIAGSGGGGGSASGGLIHTSGGSGANGAAGGTVDVVNTGSITTGGAAAAGIVAQSIGDGGGAAGSGSNSLVALGGTDSSDVVLNNGGTVSVTNSGTIATAGGGNTAPAPPVPGNTYTQAQFEANFAAAFSSAASGILAQSIGGGGGAGGGSEGLVAIGSSGQTGGGGGGVTVANTGSIGTTGQMASGIVAQSIGGGGGAGGNALGVGVGLPPVSLGGSGGNGGAGGAVTVTSDNASITTSGSGASGILAQSVGGGGGAGGATYAYNVATPGLAVSVAVGASGGSGGAGGAVSVETSNTTISTGNNTVSTGTGITPTQGNTLPSDAFGIIAQSIGGGGGTGSPATAEALALAVPVPTGEGNQSVAVTASVGVAIGGSGGAGGNGGGADVTLDQGTKIITSGQGSDGVEVQSVGGGGGNGGDSSALAATVGYGQAGSKAEVNTVSFDLSVGVGGSGGAAGQGGSATATVGPASDGGTPASVTTYGDFADGLLVQSIGGGGGNGGFGSPTTKNFGDTVNVSASIGVGGTGKAGGNGGAATATLNAGATITTYGSGADAIVVQAIGGGGGASQGDLLQLGVTASAENAAPTGGQLQLGGKLDINVGEVGGAGGTGGTATVTANGTITTAGGQAVGILAQSIGGGGGLGGSAGTDASADNPVVTSVNSRKAIVNVAQANLGGTLSFAMALGGSGGSGGDGGATEVNFGSTGAITTTGDWAAGIVAQSVGGGGGMGGTAGQPGPIAVGNFSESVELDLGNGVSFNSKYQRSGADGPSGSGGTVTLNLGGGTITTSGYGAFGVLGQAIGGGGGSAADGSANANDVINLGQYDGTGQSVGDGGTVTIPSGSSVTIATSGAGAHGIVLQSIGGGGGIGGAGNATSGAGGSYTLNVGGGTNSTSANDNGGGGPVSADGVFKITTSGASAFGILAQSIGGGGGLAFAPSVGAVSALMLGGYSQAGGPFSDTSLCGKTGNGSLPNCGGPVTLTLEANSDITTSGNGSHGIVAQSIGGGGGIAGYSPGTSGLTIAGSSSSSPCSEPTAGKICSKGEGGTVTLTNDGSITTKGQGAFGILAQSIGGGGGLADGGTALAGSTGGLSSSGGGGTVTVTSNGPISTTGTNAIGIFAQSASPSGNTNGYVLVTVNSAVQGGGGSGVSAADIQGVGVYVNGGNNANAVDVGASGSVSAMSGNAIAYSGNGYLNVNNSGTVTGSVYLNGGTTGTFYNFGTFNQGPTVQGDVMNEGGSITTIDGASPYNSSDVSGSFTMDPGSKLVINVDFVGLRSDHLIVDGATLLGGQVQVVGQTILPDRAIPFLTANGSLSLSGLQAAPDPLFTYSLAQSAGLVSVEATGAHFAPSGISLTPRELALADGLLSIWNAGGNAAFGSLFGTLDALANASLASYASTLDRLLPGAALAVGSTLAGNAQDFAGTLMSCPEFAGATALVVEGGCAWARLQGGVINQWTTSGVPGFSMSGETYQVGGQARIAPNWFLGGALAYQNSSLSAESGAVSGSGQTGYGGVALKYQNGPLLLGAALSGSFGSFSVDRYVALPSGAALATSNPATNSVDLRLRAAYSMESASWYVRPNLNLDLIDAWIPGYSETASAPVGLTYAGASQTAFVATPGVEVGKRIDLNHGATLRLYAGAGVSFLSDSTWRVTTQFEAAPPGSGAFSASMPSSDVVGRIALGAQVLTAGGIDLRLQYNGAVAGNMVTHAGQIVAALHF